MKRSTKSLAGGRDFLGNMSEESIKYFIFVSIISVENRSLTEEVKQEILSRYNPDEKWEDHNWEYILEPVGDKAKIDRLISVLESRAKLDPYDDPVVATRNDGTNVRASELPVNYDKQY